MLALLSADLPLFLNDPSRLSRLDADLLDCTCAYDSAHR
jgi:hypothetical protein